MVSGADTCGLVWLCFPLFSVPAFCATSHGSGNISESIDDQVPVGDQNELLMVFIHGIDDIATVLRLCTQEYSELKTSVLNGQGGFATSAKGGRAILASLYSPWFKKVQKMSLFCNAEVFLIMSKVTSQQELQITGYF